MYPQRHYAQRVSLHFRCAYRHKPPLLLCSWANWLPAFKIFPCLGVGFWVSCPVALGVKFPHNFRGHCATPIERTETPPLPSPLSLSTTTGRSLVHVHVCVGPIGPKNVCTPPFNDPMHLFGKGRAVTPQSAGFH